MKSGQQLLKTLSLIAAIACIAGMTSVAHASTVVAKVNGKTITLEELNKKYEQSLQFFQPKTPTKKGMLDDLIKRELGIQEARKLGLDKDPQVVDAMNTVLFNALINKKLAKQFENIHVTDAEAKAFYAKHPEIRTSHIFVSLPANATPAQEKTAYARIVKIYNDHLRSGKEDFAKVAQHYSEGVAATMGGDIGYKMYGTVDPAYYRAAVALKTPGRISGIVRSQAGYHIIKLTGVRSWSDVDHPTIKRMLIQEREHEAFNKYMAQLRAHAKVYVNTKLIK